MNPCFICGSFEPCEHRELYLLKPGRERQGRMFQIAAESTGFRQTVKKSRKRTDHTPQKHAARFAVKAAVSTGLLKPQLKCEACDSCSFIQAHHVDYSKPLFVVWLCKKCHFKADAVRKIADLLPPETVQKAIEDGSLEIHARLYQLLFNKLESIKSASKRNIDRLHRVV